jgi:hypothetical protein
VISKNFLGYTLDPWGGEWTGGEDWERWRGNGKEEREEKGFGGMRRELGWGGKGREGELTKGKGGKETE